MYRVSLGALFTPPKNTGGGVLLGDIDGDGKVDYLYIGSDGSITAWRNGGVGVPTFWQALGVVFDDSRGLTWTQFRLVCIYPVDVPVGGERVALCNLGRKLANRRRLILTEMVTRSQ